MKKYQTTIATVAGVLFIAGMASGVSAAPKFQLFGTAKRAFDPENARNQVISTQFVDDNDFGGVSRPLSNTIPALDNRIQVRYYFQCPRSCGGGAPRISLAVDTTGSNAPEGNAFGYIGDAPNFTACAQNTFVLEDLTDNQARWDISQFGGGGSYVTWDQVEAFFATQASLPGGKQNVRSGALVDDTFPGSPSNLGCAFYDNLVIGGGKLNNHSDVTGRNGPNTCGNVTPPPTETLN